MVERVRDFDIAENHRIDSGCVVASYVTFGPVRCIECPFSECLDMEPQFSPDLMLRKMVIQHLALCGLDTKRISKLMQVTRRTIQRAVLDDEVSEKLRAGKIT